MGPAGELKWVILIGGFAGVALGVWSTFREREPAGPLIFDAGPSFWLRLVCVLCVGWIVSTGLFPQGNLFGWAVPVNLFGWAVPVDLFGWAVPVDLFGWAVRALLVAFVITITGGRTQIRQHGVWFMSIFVPWNRLRAIQWPNDHKVRFVRDGWLAPSIKMTIPTSARDRVQGFLDEICDQFP